LQLASLVPYLALFIAALVAYRKEGNSSSWRAFSKRMRLQKLTNSDWIWKLLLILFSFAAYLALKQLTAALLLDKFLALPASIPRIIDPRIEVTILELAGSTVKGSWSLVVISLLVLIINIFGEELWWRGYVLPRQQASHGRNAWLVHGLLWTLFHAFKYWELIAILPDSLALSFVVQNQKNIWPGIIAHFSVNRLGVIGVFLLAVG
jgi:membrane protease YdiL (CAAX protease family)